MPSDRSRSTDLPRNGYTGVVAQQGRVILDRDFNAGQGLTADRIAEDALDFVGPCGTPDDGFRISFPKGSPHYWKPPVTPPPESPPVSPGSSRDFLISPGTMYVGGQRATFWNEQDGKTITYSYFDQPEWLDPPQPDPHFLLELVYLELVEQEVSAVEDPDLLEVALGGPDTTQRLKLLRRVRRQPATASDCATAWNDAVTRWASEGWELDSDTMQIVPAQRLKVGFTQDASTGDPCDPVATGGYVGADNQMIRVRTAGSTAAPKVVWGYDNASFLYPIASVSPDGTTLTLAFDPPDSAHFPQTGQLVEILQTAAVLGTEPQTGPSGTQTVMRVAADLDGTLATLAQPYGPATTGGTTNVMVLSQALSSEITGSELPLFVRVWQAELDAPLDSKTEIKDPTSKITTGVTVTLSSQSAVGLANGAFWQIAVRPSTPQEVYPETLQVSPQPPDGPRIWVCPLAVIDWSTNTIADCRNKFDDLVTLSRRKPGCCTVAIDPSDVSRSTTLQDLIDQAVSQAQKVTVCLGAGTYTLPGSLRLIDLHNNLTLEACGGTANIVADDAVNPALFADGLVVLAGAQSVTLRGLSLDIPYAPFESIKASNYRPDVGFGIRAINCPNLTIESCDTDVSETTEHEATDLVTAGVFVEGDCSGLTVSSCTFTSEIPLTYTPARGASGQQAVVSETPALPSGAPTEVDQALAHYDALLTPASPPIDQETLFAERADAELAVLAATRAPETTVKRVVATAGVAAFEALLISGETRRTVQCVLGDSVITDSTFSGLTFATLIVAWVASLRLRDNTVSSGVAGLWYEVPDNSTPQNLSKGTDEFSDIMDFDERLLLRSVLAAAPFPSWYHGDFPFIEAHPDYTLFVAGNEVRIRGTPEHPERATSALLLAVNGGVSEIGGLSVLVSGNHLYTVAADIAPTALLMLPALQACAISGNTIVNALGLTVNDSGYSERTASLWLLVNKSAYFEQEEQSSTYLVSVSGNALCGRSDLHFLTRADANTRPGWSPYNADPS